MITGSQYDELATLAQVARDADRQHGFDSQEAEDTYNAFWQKAEDLEIIDEDDDRLLKATSLESIEIVMGIAGEELEGVQA